MHPARAPRVAILHTWTDTQTEGWWRQAFDFLRVPFEYISVQDVAKTPSLAAKFDVIVFPPGGGSPQSIVDGLPMWRNPIPWKVSELTPNITPFAQTDDIRPGLSWQGVENLKRFVTGGGLLITSENTAELASAFGFANGVSVTNPPRLHVVGSLLRSKVVDDASPLVYGMPDSLAIYSETGMSFTITNVLARGEDARRIRCLREAQGVERQKTSTFRRDAPSSIRNISCRRASRFSRGRHRL
jgi:hypothetical protein